MKKIVVLAILAMALPITVSAATKVEYKTIPSLLSGRVTVEEYQTTGFAMENPEVWYEEPVEIADNSTSSTSSSNESNSSNESYSEPAAEPTQAPEPTPEPVPAPEPSQTYIETPETGYACGLCDEVFASADERGQHQDAVHFNGYTCTCGEWITDDVDTIEHDCQVHGIHYSYAYSYICEYCGMEIPSNGQ